MNPPKEITVLLADDHAVVRHGLRILLENNPQIRVVGEAGNGREAVALARKLRPNIILMDISMPVMNGLEATRRIVADRSSTKVIVLSAHIDDEYMERAREFGAVGYIAKQSSGETLTWAIHEVGMGHNLYNPVRTRHPTREVDRVHERNGTAKSKAGRLTSRESELLRLVAGGSPKRQVAATLSISISTVERLLEMLMAKLGVSCMAGLADYAVASGFVENDVALVIT